MEVPALIGLLETAVPGVVFEAAPSIDLQTTVYVPGDRIVDICRALRERANLRFEFLAELTAVDYWPREPRFELVYLLVSIEHRLRLRMKVRLAGPDAHVSTVSGVWPAANWLEREVWDMFGIAFDGHPDPRRLLMPEDWEGSPLRKDYPVQIRRPAYASEALQVTEQEFRDNVQRDRLSRPGPKS
jgi:NADH-quinone oxidoreductase subunit C